MHTVTVIKCSYQVTLTEKYRKLFMEIFFCQILKTLEKLKLDSNMSIIFVLLICFANNSLAFQKAATVLEESPLVISARLFGPVKFPTGDAPPEIPPSDEFQHKTFFKYQSE